MVRLFSLGIAVFFLAVGCQEQQDEGQKMVYAPQPKKAIPFEELHVNTLQNPLWWQEFRGVSPYHDLTRVDAKDFGSLKRVFVDSTQLWGMVHKNEPVQFNHLYLLRTFPPSGPFVSVLINAEFASEADQFNLVKLIVIDTTVGSAVSQLTLSSHGTDWSSTADFISDHRWSVFDTEEVQCEGEAYFRSLRRVFHFNLHPQHGVERLRIDTVEAPNCLGEK